MLTKTFKKGESENKILNTNGGKDNSIEMDSSNDDVGIVQGQNIEQRNYCLLHTYSSIYSQKVESQ